MVEAALAVWDDAATVDTIAICWTFTIQLACVTRVVRRAHQAVGALRGALTRSPRGIDAAARNASPACPAVFWRGAGLAAASDAGPVTAFDTRDTRPAVSAFRIADLPLSSTGLRSTRSWQFTLIGKGADAAFGALIPTQTLHALADDRQAAAVFTRNSSRTAWPAAGGTTAIFAPSVDAVLIDCTAGGLAARSSTTALPRRTRIGRSADRRQTDAHTRVAASFSPTVRVTGAPIVTARTGCAAETETERERQGGGS